MKPEFIVWIVAVMAASYGLFANPAKKHEDSVGSAEQTDHHRRYLRDERESGSSAYTTNTNLVGISIILKSINRALWIIVALLIIMAGPQILHFLSL